LSLGWTVAVAMLGPCPALFGATASRLERAAEFYSRAEAQKREIEALPEQERTPQAYQALADAFQKVYLTTPHSYRADDGLFAVAEIYSAMMRRFGADPWREKAAAAYGFLIKEYPHSPLSAEAKTKLAELPAASAAAPAEAGPRHKIPEVADVRHWSLPDATRVIVSLEAEVSVKSERLANPERIFFDIHNTRPAPEWRNKTLPVGDDRVKQIRVAETQLGVTRVVIDLNSDVEESLSTLSNPPRVVVELKPRTAAAKAAGPPVRPEPKADAPPAASELAATPPPPPAKAAVVKPAVVRGSGQQNLIRALGLKISRVVIDPGHGGHDTGTVGPAGLMEKDLVLDIATRLGKLITARLGSEVVFTRTDDTFVALEERTAGANEKQADLFLSIHANSSRAVSARGVETYYLNLTADREALEVAARENASSQKSVHELQDLVTRITLTEKIAESREFALQVQRSLYGAMAKDNVALRNRGVRKAPFVVLIGARMPSVLAEISFLSNPRDERLLKTASHRQKIAEALLQGLTGYCRTLSRVEVAAK